MVSATPVIVSFICFSLHSSKISKRLPLIFFFGRDVVLSLHLCFKSRQALNDKYSLSRACLHAASVQNQNDVPFLEINKKKKKYWNLLRKGKLFTYPSGKLLQETLKLPSTDFCLVRLEKPSVYLCACVCVWLIQNINDLMCSTRIRHKNFTVMSA